jgi:anti-sigma B factor antagonist
MINRDGHNDNLLKKQSNVQESIILELAGEVDMSCSNQMRDILWESFDAKPARLILDLSDVPFMDSSGLATLIEALQMSRKGKVPLRLVGLQPQVKSLFEIARLDQLLNLTRLRRGLFNLSA